MTPRRAAGPGPRTATLRSHPRAGQRPALSVALAAILSGVVIACGSATSSGSGLPESSASGGAAVRSGGPSVSFGPLPSGLVLPSIDPDATPHWHGATVLAMVHLGIADTEIQKAGDDLTTATNNQDLKAMWGAADGLAKLIDDLMPEVGFLNLDPETTPIQQLYLKSFPEISAGAKQLRDSITAGDANGIVAGSQGLARGLNDYGAVRDQLTDLFEQAVLQQRLYTR